MWNFSYRDRLASCAPTLGVPILSGLPTWVWLDVSVLQWVMSTNQRYPHGEQHQMSDIRRRPGCAIMDEPLPEPPGS
jgi:hypothetical protein